MEINLFELGSYFRRMDAYMALASDESAGKRERADYLQKHKQLEIEVTTYLLNLISNRRDIITEKDGKYYV